VSETKRIRVMIVDDHLMVRDGIQTFLSVYDDLEVIAEAGDGNALAVGDLDDHLAGDRLAGAAVDLDCDLIRHLGLSVRGHRHQAASTMLLPCST